MYRYIAGCGDKNDQKQILEKEPYLDFPNLETTKYSLIITIY